MIHQFVHSAHRESILARYEKSTRNVAQDTKPAKRNEHLPARRHQNHDDQQIHFSCKNVCRCVSQNGQAVGHHQSNRNAATRPLEIQRTAVGQNPTPTQPHDAALLESTPDIAGSASSARSATVIAELWGYTPDDEWSGICPRKSATHG